jgi:hypothetical protein
MQRNSERKKTTKDGTLRHARRQPVAHPSGVLMGPDRLEAKDWAREMEAEDARPRRESDLAESTY